VRNGGADDCRHCGAVQLPVQIGQRSRSPSRFQPAAVAAARNAANVDRLTRSLADFAKIVEVLDGHGASFVSVTQQFNTTTSMGRLTLNVLLSFAQFEREVAGERIRDKIAASRRKGMWMGGSIPLGYDVKDRELVTNEVEATTVRAIFETYVRLGSVARLQTELNQARHRQQEVGVVDRADLGRGPVRARATLLLLRNPVYVGRVSHKGQVFEGRQAPIVDLTLWEKVQELLAVKSAGRNKRQIVPGGRPLAGRLFDDRGNAMSPSYTNHRSGRRYAYYISLALLQNDKGRAGTVARIRAEEIERLVSHALTGGPDGNWNEVLPRLGRVVIHRDQVQVQRADASEEEDPTMVVPVSLSRRNRARVLDDGTAGPASTIVRALARAHEWRGWLQEGQVHSYRDIAVKATVDASYVRTILPLAFLDPRLTRELLDGRRQVHGSLTELLRRGIPLDWQQQHVCFTKQSG
jgi:site-specific DNA recombinase